jgi:hypothetical protein
MTPDRSNIIASSPPVRRSAQGDPVGRIGPMSRRPALCTQADIVLALKAVVQSGNPHAFYDDALLGWDHRKCVAAAYRAGKRTAVLRINLATPERTNVPRTAFLHTVETP